jgi:hypothetical protein
MEITDLSKIDFEDLLKYLNDNVNNSIHVANGNSFVNKVENIISVLIQNYVYYKKINVYLGDIRIMHDVIKEIGGYKILYNKIRRAIS